MHWKVCLGVANCKHPEIATIQTRSISLSQQKLYTLQAEWNLRTEKIKQMRQALAIEAGTAIKFQLEQQLLDEETKLAYLTDELARLESALKS